MDTLISECVRCHAAGSDDFLIKFYGEERYEACLRQFGLCLACLEEF